MMRWVLVIVTVVAACNEVMPRHSTAEERPQVAESAAGTVPPAEVSRWRGPTVDKRNVLTATWNAAPQPRRHDGRGETAIGASAAPPADLPAAALPKIVLSPLDRRPDEDDPTMALRKQFTEHYRMFASTLAPDREQGLARALYWAQSGFVRGLHDPLAPGEQLARAHDELAHDVVTRLTREEYAVFMDVVGMYGLISEPFMVQPP